jgi:two-component system phosphate regulon response regulator PhoB
LPPRAGSGGLQRRWRLPSPACVQKHILIVEDEPAIRDMVAFALRKAGMDPAHANDARGAQGMIAERVPDLILLDWMLPGMSGLDLARRLRKDELTRNVPIIMLTARGEETDRVGGFEAGVDDYVVKPFSPRELIARINAVMRRTHGVDDGIVSVGALKIDSSAHRVYARTQAPGTPDGVAAEAIVPIGPTEYRLLHFFMTHAERVYSRSQLLDYVWGGSVYVEERTVDVHIRRLRKTLEPHGLENLVQTVRGTGYRFSTSA